jgi:hypothetical protein
VRGLVGDLWRCGGEWEWRIYGWGSAAEVWRGRIIGRLGRRGVMLKFDGLRNWHFLL